MTHTTSLATNLQLRISRPARALVVAQQDSQRSFLIVVTLLFFVSTAVTVFWCNSMSAMSPMPMPGGWTMSMAWMRMPGQTWASATVSFVVMWVVMMIAMMLPSFAPTLWRYHHSVAPERQTHRGQLTALLGLGYFFVWTLFGLAVFPLGVAASAIEMTQPAIAHAVPLVAGLIVVIAGALQFTAWKTRHLALCHEAPEHSCLLPLNAGGAWRRGLHFGLHCGLSCANLTAILLVVGVMDLRAMAVVTTAIAAERLAPASELVARSIGLVAVLGGVILIARTALVT